MEQFNATKWHVNLSARFVVQVLPNHPPKSSFRTIFFSVEQYNNRGIAGICLFTVASNVFHGKQAWVPYSFDYAFFQQRRQILAAKRKWHGPAKYEIEVKGHLGSHWSEWFDDLIVEDNS